MVHCFEIWIRSAYQACLAYELTRAGFRVELEKEIPIQCEEIKLACGFRTYLIMEGLVIVECKAKQKFHPSDMAQLASHLRLTRMQVGLSINFHEVVLKNGLERIVNNYKPEE